MLFSWAINVPSNTTEAVPIRQTLSLAHGIISWVSVSFPPGCHGMVNCEIHHYSHQIFPSVEDMELAGDAFPIEWNEYYEMYAEPYELRATLWSPGTSYDHVVTIKIAILPRKAIIALAMVEAIKSIFSKLSPRRILTGGG